MSVKTTAEGYFFVALTFCFCMILQFVTRHFAVLVGSLLPGTLDLAFGLSILLRPSLLPTILPASTLLYELYLQLLQLQQSSNLRRSNLFHHHGYTFRRDGNTIHAGHREE